MTWLIRDIVFEHHRQYGSPRVREELRRLYGKQVSRKKVARLMRENGLNVRRSRKFIPTTSSNHELPVCENLLDRQFGAEKGGQQWGSDITSLRATGGCVPDDGARPVRPEGHRLGVKRRQGDPPRHDSRS